MHWRHDIVFIDVHSQRLLWHRSNIIDVLLLLLL